jgi:hypothetical protein
MLHRHKECTQFLTQHKMAPKTRKQTPSNTSPSKSGTNANSSSVVTPDKVTNVDKSTTVSPIPKKDRKRSADRRPENTKNNHQSTAASDAIAPNTPKKVKKSSKSEPPSAPAKKIEGKPRAKKHKKEEINKFTQLYKQIETTQPVVPATQSVSTQLVNSFEPSARKCNAYTYGTYDGCVVYSVFAYLSNRNPAYTSNIKMQIENDPDLKESLHLLLTVNKRDDHNPFEYWKTQLPMRIQDDGRVRFKYWPIYVRLFDNSDDNTPDNRKKWALDFTIVANDLAPKNADGTNVRYTAVNIEYQSDMGLSHLADYLTVMDVFFEIERRWINSQATSPEHRIELQKTKVFNNKALLTVFFGDDENFLEQVKKYYKDTRRLTDDDVPPGVEDPNEDNSEDDSEGEDDSENESEGNNDEGQEQNKEREQGEDDDDENENKEQAKEEEECRKEGIDVVDCNTETKVGKDDNGITKQDRGNNDDSVGRVEQTQQHGEGTSKKNTQCAMSEMFKSVDRSM